MKSIRLLMGVALATWVQTRGISANEVIVWNYGPTTGLASENWFQNWADHQELADTVSFSSNTSIAGFNLFTSQEAMPPKGSQYRVTFYQDTGGLPGAVFAEHNVSANSTQYVGLFPTPLGSLAGVHQVNLRFNPVLLTAGEKYWVGATGFGFNVGQLGVWTPGDAAMAILIRTAGVAFMSGSHGDQMFQLVAVPEPSSVILLVTLAAVAVIARIKNGNRCGRQTGLRRAATRSDNKTPIKYGGGGGS